MKTALQYNIIILQNNSSPLGCAVIKNHSEVVEYILKLNETQKDLVSVSYNSSL